MSVEAKEALVGRFAVNEDNNKVRVIGVFNIAREGVAVTVALLCFPIENDLSIRTIDGLFDDYSVFLDELAADTFIAGHRNKDVTTPGEPTDVESPANENPQTTTPGKTVSLGRRIKAAREDAGLTPAALGKLIGVTAQVVKKWEKDGASPSRKQLMSLARATGAQFLLDDDQI